MANPTCLIIERNIAWDGFDMIEIEPPDTAGPAPLQSTLLAFICQLIISQVRNIVSGISVEKLYHTNVVPIAINSSESY